MRSLNRRYGRRRRYTAWLFTHDINTINTAIINMVSDITGMICDGGLQQLRDESLVSGIQRL